MPICLGYLSVSFAFGIFAVGMGLSVWQTVLISVANLTSAGQLAGVPIMVGSLPMIEMVLTQFVINLRYSLMSVSLSQKLSPRVKLLQRMAVAFGVTDEIFAVAISKKEDLETPYLLGLITSPFWGWTIGTALGALAGDILPDIVVSALGIALYAMFVAIIIPPAKKNHAVALCCTLAMALSAAFRYIPKLNEVSSGIAIIICALVAGGLFAWIAPIPEDDEDADARKEPGPGEDPSDHDGRKAVDA
ncbi:MAG: AzlC family ABC transporter permease [Clostridiales bacterium]|nr:AzlC family ABC transporter permease [Clostridiales bacterium]